MRGTINAHGESLTSTEQLSNSMDLPGKHPSFNLGFDEPTGLSFQDNAADPQLHHQGMSVQTLNSSCPPSFNQSAADQNNADSVHPLTGFRITSLTQPVSIGLHKSDIPTIPAPDMGDYVPKNSVESVDDASLIISSSYHCAQSSLSGNEPGIRDPTPVNRLSSDHHLTNLPTELANPQDSRPDVVANPPNLQQATSGSPANSTKIVADKSSQAERQRERYRNDPVFAQHQREYQREYQRERRKNPAYIERDRSCRKERRKDPDYLERERKRQRERQRARYKNDPVFAERQREYQREYQRERRKNPAYIERARACRMERRKDPDYIEHERKRQREAYRNNPTFAQRQKTRQNERYKSDPVFAERKRKIERERHRNNPSSAQRKRERYKNDPIYAESLRTYNRVYTRMIKKVGKEKASKLAITARKEYLQSVICPGDSGNLPKNSTSAETTQNANENSDTLGNESDTREPASANRLNPDYHLTTIPAEPANPQDSRPVTIASPIQENLPSSISESPDGVQASGAAGKFFTSPPKPLPITTHDSKELCQDEASEISVKPKKTGSGSELEIKIVRVWSMTNEEGSHFFNNHHSNIETSLIIQADNSGNEFVRRCVTQKNATTRRQPIQQPHKCNQCDKAYAYMSYLKRHQTIHSDAKPYKCRQCNTRFARKDYLKRHQIIHTERKPYKCKQCDKRFARKYYLKSHQIIHTERKPYKCKQCDQRFAQKRYLAAHQDVHAGKSLMSANSAAKSLALENSQGRH